MAIGANLRRMRVTKGLTQKDLAEPQYTHAYISSTEDGKRQPSEAALKYSARRLGAAIDELVTGVSPELSTQLDAELALARRRLSGGGFEEDAATTEG
jgi:transcriptional regulator with XRE-family HTH domain